MSSLCVGMVCNINFLSAYAILIFFFSPPCSANLKCTRATTGRCPNTNSPYCASLSQTSQTPSRITINPITPTLITEFPFTPTYLPSAVPDNWVTLLRYEDSDNRENALPVLDAPM